MIYIGIDPGLTGAVAILNDDAGGVQVYDTPILTIEKNKSSRFRLPGESRKSIRHEMDAIGAANILRWTVGNPLRVSVAIERVNPMPEQGIASAGNFMKGFGIWLGIIAAFNLPVDLVHPTRWKKVMMDGMGKEKQASILRAKELFPSIDLSLKKHHGRADALLLAEYRRRLG